MKDVIWTVLFKCVVTSELEIASWAVLVAVRWLVVAGAEVYSEGNRIGEIVVFGSGN